MQLDTVRTSGNAIQSYGPAGFKVSAVDYPTSILLTDSFIAPLQAISLADISMETLAPLLAQMPRIEVLVIGTGTRMERVSEPLRQQLRAQGVGIDAMDTGAACRTYTILHSEGRRVGAALLLPQ